MDEPVCIPRTLDAPHLFLFVEVDTAVIFLGTLLIAALFSIWIAGPIAWLLVRFYVRHKNQGSRGGLMHRLYWYTPSSYWLSSLASSSRREYLGR